MGNKARVSHSAEETLLVNRFLAFFKLITVELGYNDIGLATPYL
jgi:hypothetical protein